MSVQQHGEDATATRPKGRDELKPVALFSRRPQGGREPPVPTRGNALPRVWVSEKTVWLMSEKGVSKAGRDLKGDSPVAVSMELVEMAFV